MRKPMKTVLYVIIFIAAIRIYFLILEQKTLYYPDREIIETPAKVGLDYEEVNFPTTYDGTLNGWYVPAKGASVTVMFLHGNAGNISHRLHKALFFHEMGVNFFIFDYSGYGKSTGRPCEKRLYDDAAAAYDYLVNRGDIDKSRIVIYGKSLGGAVAAELAVRREAAALVIESSFANIELRAQEMFPFLPMKFLTSQKYDTRRKVRRITIPKLILHGISDELINIRHGRILYEEAAEPKQFMAFEGGHNDELYVTSHAFRRALEKFLDEHSID